MESCSKSGDVLAFSLKAREDLPKEIVFDVHSEARWPNNSMKMSSKERSNMTS